MRVENGVDGQTIGETDKWQRFLKEELLIDRERRVLEAFFGHEIIVPKPPSALLAIMEQAEILGWKGLEPHFLSGQNMGLLRNLTTWKSQPKPWFWDQIEERKIASNAAVLPYIWTLADGTQTPKYQSGEQMYEDDFLTDITSEARAVGEIDSRSRKPIGSRFNLIWDEINKIILPTISERLKINPKQAGVRLP